MITNSSCLFRKYAKKKLRYLEELKNPVSAVLEECINDDASNLSRLKKVWRGLGGSLEDQIMEELDRYWKGLAQKGRTLEEAAR